MVHGSKLHEYVLSICMHKLLFYRSCLLCNEHDEHRDDKNEHLINEFIGIFIVTLSFSMNLNSFNQITITIYRKKY